MTESLLDNILLSDCNNNCTRSEIIPNDQSQAPPSRIQRYFTVAHIGNSVEIRDEHGCLVESVDPSVFYSEGYNLPIMR